MKLSGGKKYLSPVILTRPFIEAKIHKMQTNHQ
jgi:hypothetical protein